MSKHKSKSKSAQAEPDDLGTGALNKVAQKIKDRNKRTACAAKQMGYDQTTGKCSGNL